MSTRQSAYRALAATRPRPVVDGDPVTAFEARLTVQGGRCLRLPDLPAARRWLAEFMATHGADSVVADAQCLTLFASAEPPLAIRAAAAREEARIGLCRALAGVAETGSVLLHPGKDSPLGLCFLAEHLVVLLRVVEVVDGLEALWERVRSGFAAQTPRALCLVSGPSTSGDIEMQFATGVHGPVSLHVLLIEERG